MWACRPPSSFGSVGWGSNTAGLSSSRVVLWTVALKEAKPTPRVGGTRTALWILTNGVQMLDVFRKRFRRALCFLSDYAKAYKQQTNAPETWHYWTLAQWDLVLENKDCSCRADSRLVPVRPPRTLQGPRLGMPNQRSVSKHRLGPLC